MADRMKEDPQRGGETLKLILAILVSLGVFFGLSGLSHAFPEVEDFEQYAEGADPDGWLDTAPGDHSLTEDNFYVALWGDGNHVFQTDSTATNIHSHLVGTSFENGEWSNYEFLGRMFITASNSGIGITIYSDYPNSDSYYRLRRYGSGSFHFSPHPDGHSTCVGTTDTGVVPEADSWYSFRFRAFEEDAGTRLQAKVWEHTTTEPDWQVACFDPFGSGFGAGSPGVWSMGSGTKSWDDLEVRPIYESCVLDSDCDDGLHCNGAETCVNDLCTVGAPIICPTLPECYTLECREGLNASDTRCHAEIWPPLTPCDDGNPGTENDVCITWGCYGTYPTVDPPPLRGTPLDPPRLETLRWVDGNEPGIVTSFRVHQATTEGQYTIHVDLGLPIPDEDIYSSEIDIHSYPAWVNMTAISSSGVESNPSNTKKLYVPEPGFLAMLIPGITLLWLLNRRRSL